MNTRSLVDQTLLPLLDLLPKLALSADSLADLRAKLADMLSAAGELPVAAEIQTVAGPAGPIEVFWFDPAPGNQNRAALLYIHGGGMVLGSARLMQAQPSALAAALGIPVASVEYRRAPETPFPGPQEDCFAALKWLSQNAADLGVDPRRIGIAGESAGGGLAAAVAQMARDAGGPALAVQILSCPMLDHRTGSEDCRWRNRHTGEFGWTHQSNQFGWEALRANYVSDDHRKGWFSPSLADDLSGLPPAWIGVGALDLFLDENMDYARRLADAGVPVEFHCYPGAFHGFSLASGTPLVAAFDRDLHGAIARWLGLDAKISSFQRDTAPLVDNRND